MYIYVLLESGGVGVSGFKFYAIYKGRLVASKESACGSECCSGSQKSEAKLGSHEVSLWFERWVLILHNFGFAHVHYWMQQLV